MFSLCLSTKVIYMLYVSDLDTVVLFCNDSGGQFGPGPQTRVFQPEYVSVLVGRFDFHSRFRNGGPRSRICVLLPLLLQVTSP